MYSKFFRGAKKIYTIGFSQSMSVLRSRIDSKLFTKKWYTAAIKKNANHSWETIKRQHELSGSFLDYFKILQKKFVTFLSHDFLLDYNDSYVFAKAQQAKNTLFDVLGSGPCNVSFSGKNQDKNSSEKKNKISWHTDFRLQRGYPGADYTFQSDTYYKHISITPHSGDDLAKDIKVPWELARFQHLIFLGKAYQKTGDLDCVTTFTHHVLDWIEQNPFLLGIHWLCPMEVGLRAINLIWAFYFFNSAPITQETWEKIVASLYDHFIYLENNWELYDGRTSNHYVSDLVGYVYLCFFFSEIFDTNKKAINCSKRIFQEMQKQVFDEGASYEGSTQYHRLVTELFYHASIMMQLQGIKIPQWYTERLKKMCTFIDWCSPSDGNLISVGDHDSGSVLYGGLSKYVIKKYKNVDSGTIKHFSQFGLSILKNKNWHITLRHHAYNKRQPSGHFHHDAASITLAYNRVPIFVDPGSFVYTASTFWRNYFRSTHVHSTFFIEHEELSTSAQHMFYLDLPEKMVDELSTKDNILYAQHDVYKKFGLHAQRKVEWNEAGFIQITDSWLPLKQAFYESNWNFTLSPELNVRRDGNFWIVCKDARDLVVIRSNDLLFEKHQGWVSPSYGVKIPCILLRAQKPIEHTTTWVTTIHSLSAVQEK